MKYLNPNPEFQNLWEQLPDTIAIYSHIGLHPVKLSWSQLYKILCSIAYRLQKRGIRRENQVIIHATSGQSELYTFLLLNTLSLLGCKVVLPMNSLGKEAAIWKKRLPWDFAFAPLQLDIYHSDSFHTEDNQALDVTELLGTDLESFIKKALKSKEPPFFIEKETTRATEEIFISTSGSSGKPKFLSYSWSSFIKSAQSWDKAELFDEKNMGGTGLTLLFAHTMGIRTWVNSLYNKNGFCLMDTDLFQAEPTVAAYLLGQMKPNHITGGPALYGMLLELSRYVPQLNEELRASLKSVVLSGAPWAPQLAERIQSTWGVWPINAFGTTETLQVMRQTASDAGSGNLGQPLPGVKLYLKESDSELFQMGFSTPFSAVKCYYSEKEALLVESPFFTNDMVSKNEKGEIRFINRQQKDFFKDAFGVKIHSSLLMKWLPQWEQGSLLFEGMVDRPGLILTIVKDLDKSQEKNSNILSEWVKQANAFNQNINSDLDDKEAQHYRIFRLAYIEHSIPKTRKGGKNEFQLRLELKDFLSSATLSYFKSSNIQDLEESSDKQNLLNGLNPRYASMLKLIRLDEVIVEGFKDWIKFENREEEFLDCLGGFGVNLFGHNKKELIDIAIEHLSSKRISIADQGSFQIEAAKLCRDLQQMLLDETGKNYRIFLTNSGAESADLALRHAFLVWQKKLNQIKQKELFKIHKNCPEMEVPFEQKWQKALTYYKPLILCMEKSFHGNLISLANITRNSDGSNLFSVIAPFEEFSISDVSDMRTFKETEEMLLPLVKRVSNEWCIDVKKTSRHMATIVEPVRGEGGVLVQEDKILEYFTHLEAPLISDSIQCGLGRCGSLIGSSISFDSILFGKALGGGIERIAAVAIAQESYNHNLDKYATNTFGNGGLASSVAQKTLEIIRREKASLKSMKIGESIEKMLMQFQLDFPDWVESISGKGLLWGIKFSFNKNQEDFFVRLLAETEIGGYLLASWLFHSCNIRITPTLSAHHTLRIEPSIYFGQKEIAFLKDGLYRLGRILTRGDWYALCLPLVYEDPWKEITPEIIDYRNKISTVKESPAPEATRVGFVVHFMHGEEELLHIVPCFRKFSKPALQMLFHHFMQLSEFKAVFLFAHNMHNGKIWMNAKTLTADVATLKGHLSPYQGEKLLKELQNAVDGLAKEGCRYVSLGAFTSIISDNGLRLIEPPHCQILTGNTLTVAHSLHLLYQNLNSQSTVCIVGGKGNIGAALVRKLLQSGTLYKKVILFGRRAQLFKEELEQLFGTKNVSHIEYTTNFSRLCEGDLIVGASSSSEPIIFPHHIKRDKKVAILDLAVPSAVAPATYELPNVHSLVAHPGLEMPEDRDFLMSPILPPGVTYCCAAEAILCGLSEHEGVKVKGSLRGKIDLCMIDSLQVIAEEHKYFQKAIALENYEALPL